MRICIQLYKMRRLPKRAKRPWKHKKLLERHKIHNSINHAFIGRAKLLVQCKLVMRLNVFDPLRFPILSMSMTLNLIANINIFESLASITTIRLITKKKVERLRERKGSAQELWERGEERYKSISAPIEKELVSRQSTGFLRIDYIARISAPADIVQFFWRSSWVKVVEEKKWSGRSIKLLTAIVFMTSEKNKPIRRAEPH